MADRTVAIVGTGRVGLPLALYLADRGMTVHGIDADPERVACLRAGRMPFLERGAPELLARHLGSRFLPTEEAAAVEQAEVVILTLGTPVDEHLNPDFGAIESVLASLRPHLRAGQLFVLRSTVTPGTTEFVKRRIEQTTPLRVGRDLHLAFCPERIAEGRSLEELPEIPQIVGALDEPSRARAAAFFEGIAGPILATDARSAEIAKLFCNVYRYIDFAIGNEFMMIADTHERDIYEIVDLVNRGYKRGGLKRPGFTGGPCLYKDGFFLVERTPYPDLLTTAWKINESLPAYLIEGLARRFGGSLEDRTVLVLGLAFKKEIDDTRNSLAFKTIKILGRRGARVLRHDPFVAKDGLDAALAEADAAIVCTDHEAYRELGIRGLRERARPSLVVCDVWNVFGRGKVFFTLGES